MTGKPCNVDSDPPLKPGGRWCVLPQYGVLLKFADYLEIFTNLFAQVPTPSDERNRRQERNQNRGRRFRPCFEINHECDRTLRGLPGRPPHLKRCPALSGSILVDHEGLALCPHCEITRTLRRVDKVRAITPRARPRQWRDILAAALAQQVAISVRGTVISHLRRTPRFML